jgi:hypothetical protein
MKAIELKVWPEYYGPLSTGLKTWELRNTAGDPLPPRGSVNLFILSALVVSMLLFVFGVPVPLILATGPAWVLTVAYVSVRPSLDETQVARPCVEDKA